MQVIHDFPSGQASHLYYKGLYVSGTGYTALLFTLHKQLNTHLFIALMALVEIWALIEIKHKPYHVGKCTV